MSRPVRALRPVVAAWIAAAALAVVGCDSGGGSTSNPDLKVPTVPAGRGTDNGGTPPKDVKQKKS